MKCGPVFSGLDEERKITKKVGLLGVGRDFVFNSRMDDIERSNLEKTILNFITTPNSAFEINTWVNKFLIY